MLPMWQSEAMWLQFDSVWPFAIKVSTGKRSAVTGKPWAKTLREGDYLCAPKQKWLDGYVVEDGVIRQFVAAPLGMGMTAEEQITGKDEFGGLQIEVFPMSFIEFEKRWPERLRPVRMVEISDAFYLDDGDGVVPCCATSDASFSSDGLRIGESKTRSVIRAQSVRKSIARPDMGLAPGGQMKQQVFTDEFGLDVWDQCHHDRCFVHLSNSLAWKAITGKDAPTMPLSAATYSRCGMPWFDSYDDGPVVKPSKKLAGLKSVVQLGTMTGNSIVFENESAKPKKIEHIRAGKW